MPALVGLHNFQRIILNIYFEGIGTIYKYLNIILLFISHYIIGSNIDDDNLI